MDEIMITSIGCGVCRMRDRERGDPYLNRWIIPKRIQTTSRPGRSIVMVDEYSIDDCEYITREDAESPGYEMEA